jgi:hypothetical protein
VGRREAHRDWDPLAHRDPRRARHRVALGSSVIVILVILVVVVVVVNIASTIILFFYFFVVDVPFVIAFSLFVRLFFFGITAVLMIL